jgi:alanine racemase
MSRPIQAICSSSALLHNIANLRQRSLGSHLFVAIKANAYGHGFQWVAEIIHPYVDGFCILNLEDAIILRNTGHPDVPILMLEGAFSKDELFEMAHHKLMCVVHNEEQLAWLADLRLANRLDIWVKINTGMNRLGFSPLDAVYVLEKLASFSHVNIRGLMTHFACADDLRYGVDSQWIIFELLRQKYQNLPISAANSAATCLSPQTHGDMVRIGGMAYGLSTLDQSLGVELDLKPVMRLDAKIIAIQHVASGDYVGYGFSFQASKGMRIGIVACGYADGYPRTAHFAPVEVGGKITYTVGRVSMDMLAIDLTSIPEANLGSWVNLWGGSMVSCEAVADSAHTISYELTCAVMPRVHFCYQE